MQLTPIEREALANTFKYHAQCADMIVQKGRRTIEEALSLQMHQRKYREAAAKLGGTYLATVNGVTVCGAPAE